MEGWKVWALLGVIAIAMLISAALAARMYPMPITPSTSTSEKGH